MRLKKHYWILQCQHGDVIDDGDPKKPRLFPTKLQAADWLRTSQRPIPSRRCQYEPQQLFVTDGIEV